MRTATSLKLTPALLPALALGACGGERSTPTVDSGSEAAGGTDRAFAVQMAEHHEGAIEMAELAAERAQHREVKQLARDIVSSPR